MSSGFKRTRAPAGGYAFDAKQDYRVAVWRRIRALLQCDVARRHAALMPSNNRAEVDAAISVGFREENLHIIDGNPANVATLKRLFPRINTYGVDLRRAVSRVPPGALAAANFDLTSCVSIEVTRILGDVVASGAFAEQSVVCVNVLRGREGRGSFLRRDIALSELPRGLSELVRIYSGRHRGAYELTGGDILRLAHIQLAGRVDHQFLPAGSGSYLSPAAGQTMLWSAWSLYSMKPFDREFRLPITAASRRRFRHMQARFERANAERIAVDAVFTEFVAQLRRIELHEQRPS